MIDQPHLLWLLPEPEALALLGQAIRELSETLGGPLFTPHLTLLSQITGSPDILAGLTKRLAGQISPFELTVRGPSYSEHYHRAIVLGIEKNPLLDDVIRLAKETFRGGAREPFAPHLSLAYGRIDEDRARASLSEILPSIPARLRAGAIELVSASSQTPVGSWRSLCVFPLLGAHPTRSA